MPTCFHGCNSGTFDPEMKCSPLSRLYIKYTELSLIRAEIRPLEGTIRKIEFQEVLCNSGEAREATSLLARVFFITHTVLCPTSDVCWAYVRTCVPTFTFDSSIFEQIIRIAIISKIDPKCRPFEPTSSTFIIIQMKERKKETNNSKLDSSIHFYKK